MPRRGTGLASIFALLLGTALLVGAQGSLPSRSAAQSDASSDSDARAMFEQGRAAYAAGNFEEAVRAFRRAYLLSPRFALLYNIGQAELRAGHDQLALDAFEGFLRQSPADDSRRSEVEERIRVLRAMGVTESGSTATATTTTSAETTTTATTTSEPPPETHETTSTEATTTSTTEDGATADAQPTPSSGGGGDAGVVPWIVVGVGGALVVVGAVLMGVGASDASRVTGATRGTSWSDIQGAAGDANTLWGVGIGCLVAGVVAAGAGVVWAVVGGGGGSGDRATARLRVGPGGVSLEGEF